MPPPPPRSRSTVGALVQHTQAAWSWSTADEPPVRAEVAEGRRALAGLLVQSCQIEMRVGEGGIDRQRGAIRLDRIRRACQVLEGDAEVVGRGGVVGVLTEGRPVVPLGLGDESLLVQQPAEVDV